MTEKTWIKVHTGLTNDGEHRRRIGIRIWYFMWLVDHADYETGLVRNYTDAWAAEDMDMPESTVRKHRTGLQDERYIVCHQGFQCEHIRIMKWRNPKQVEAQQINLPDDKTTWCPLLDTHGTTVLDTHAPSKVDTLTLGSHSSQGGSPKGKRKSNPEFDAVCLVCHIDKDKIPTEASHIGKQVRLLKEAGWSAQDIQDYHAWRESQKKGKAFLPTLVEDMAITDWQDDRRIKQAAAMLDSDAHVFDEYDRMYGDQSK